MFIKLLVYRIKKLYHFVTTLLLKALPANLYYGFPSRRLKVITVTGTDGKTTTSSLLNHILNASGRKSGLISTVSASIGHKQIDTGFHVTTPGPFLLQKLLKMCVDQHCQFAVIETTSHGAYQFRTWGVKPFIAAITNITHFEALDYHITYQEYLKAKAYKARQAKEVWINPEDESYSLLKQYIEVNKLRQFSFKLLPQTIRHAISAVFPQTYNQANATLVFNICHSLGISDQEFIDSLQTFKGISGRMQTIENNLGITAMVDFAHTPNALKQALTYLKDSKLPAAQLICVFGCASKRDPSKRPEMGEIATQLADLCIFTAEDPRDESVWDIIRQMKEQLHFGHQKIASIPDRAQAISFALTQANKGDIIAVFGKGHEQSMAYGSREYSWSDIDYMKELVS